MMFISLAKIMASEVELFDSFSGLRNIVLEIT
jgi:hypothetical protein